MSLKYADETTLQEMVVKTKQHVESVRSTLDLAKQNKMELATMPQASEDYLGLVVIYTGVTNSTYTHGYIYECVSDGGDPATYSWQQITVQDSVQVDGTTIVKDSQTDIISAAVATNNTVGVVKSGDGTSIAANGGVDVTDRLREEYVDDPGSTVQDVGRFALNTTEHGDYKKGGIYQLVSTQVTPVGTENPSDEGWYEYDSTNQEYELSEDVTVDVQKTYYTIAWVLVSANSTEFDSDDFDVVGDNVSLDVSQRTFTGTRDEWDTLSSSEKALYKQVALTDDEVASHADTDNEIADMNNILGAKNLLPVTMVSQVLSGITFTVDASSGVISVSGSNSGSPFSDVLGITTLTPGTYKVTTGQTPELNAQIGIAITDASSGTIIARSWNGTEVFTISSNTQVRFHIEVNVTGAITSTVVYPMCRPLSIKDEKYVPYAPTNRALTLRVSSFEKKFNTQVSMTVQPNTTYFNAASSQSCAALKIGYLVVMNLVLSVKDNVTVPAGTLACTITNVGAISANSSIFLGGNGTSNITRLMLRRNQSNSDNLDVYFIDSYSNSSMRASLVFMVNTIV